MVLLLSADGVIQNKDPYRIVEIVAGQDGKAYARFAEIAGGWLLTQCERVLPVERHPGEDDVADDDVAVDDAEVPF
jgi:hypothetical protein